MSVQGSMAYIYGKIKGRLGALASQDIMTKLEQAPSVEAAVKLLQNTSYDALYRAWSESGDLRAAELALLDDEVHFLQSLSNAPGVAGVSRALLEYYQVLQIKEALRFFFDAVIRGRGGQPHQLFSTKVLYTISWDHLFNATTLEQFCSHLPSAYASRIMAAKPSIETDKSLFTAETSLDVYYLQNLAAAVKKQGGKDSQRLVAYINKFADLLNLQCAIRFVDYYKFQAHEIAPLLCPVGRAKHLFEEDTSGDPVRALAESLGLSGNTQDIIKDIARLRKEAARSLFAGSPFSPAVLVGYAQLRREESGVMLRLIYTKYYESRKKQWEGRSL